MLQGQSEVAGSEERLNMQNSLTAALWLPVPVADFRKTDACALSRTCRTGLCVALLRARLRVTVSQDLSRGSGSFHTGSLWMRKHSMSSACVHMHAAAATSNAGADVYCVWAPHR